MLINKFVKIRVPGSTSNLGPCLDTIGLAVKLYNIYTFTMDETVMGVNVTIKGFGADDVNKGYENLAYKGIQSVFNSFGIEIPGIRIEQDNEIPIARGLGGSSTAILAGIMAGFYFLGIEDVDDIILNRSVALDGFADNISPSFLGGLVVSTIVNGQVIYIKLPIHPIYKAVVYIPDIGIPTGQSRQVLPSSVSFNDAIFNIRSSALLIAALTTGSYEKLNVAMRDRLHQPYRAALLPSMFKIFDAALAAGACGVSLNGAGSGIIAFLVENEQEVAKSMVRTGIENGLGGYSLQLQFESEGAKIIET